ncbi:MAG: YccF domain-containing protein [Fusobacteriaceae bacterium]
MSLILNIIWLFLGGLILAFEWAIAGVLSIIFIVTIPFASGCFEMAMSCLAPFGKEVVEKQNYGFPPRPISAFFWIVFIGIWLAISHIFSGIAMCLTIVGIPLGIQNFKLAKVAFNPYKYSLVDRKIY